jgi:hypothetical protein
VGGHETPELPAVDVLLAWQDHVTPECARRRRCARHGGGPIGANGANISNLMVRVRPREAWANVSNPSS